MDPLHFCIAVAPLAVYLLLLGVLNLMGRPFLTTGARDTAALGIGIAGLIVAGPMELFFPEAAASQFGGYVWLMLLAFYGLTVSLIVLLMRPRIVIYNITRDQVVPILRSVAQRIDSGTKWAGDSAMLPTTQIHFHIESNDFLRNVQLTAGGNRQSYEGWRTLERELAESLPRIKVGFNATGFVLLMVSAILSLGTAIWMVSDPEAVTTAWHEMLRHR